MATTEQAAAALKALSNCLAAQRIPFFLDGGTLLGAIRDQDFCADDHVDIDLTVMDGTERLPAALAQAALLGLHLAYSWPRSERGTLQLVVKRDGVKLDIMCKEVALLDGRHGEYLYWTVYGKGDRAVPKGIPMYLVRGDRWVEFHGNRYRVPFKAEEYLTYRYGNWQVPVHRKEYSCYSTDLAILPPGTVVHR
jgi:hypothetical protein